jgi:hypothetical protein
MGQPADSGSLAVGQQELLAGGDVARGRHRHLPLAVGPGGRVQVPPAKTATPTRKYAACHGAGGNADRAWRQLASASQRARACSSSLSQTLRLQHLTFSNACMDGWAAPGALVRRSPAWLSMSTRGTSMRMAAPPPAEGLAPGAPKVREWTTCGG